MFSFFLTISLDLQKCLSEQKCVDKKYLRSMPLSSYIQTIKEKCKTPQIKFEKVFKYFAKANNTKFRWRPIFTTHDSNGSFWVFTQKVYSEYKSTKVGQTFKSNIFVFEINKHFFSGFVDGENQEMLNITRLTTNNINKNKKFIPPLAR